MTEPFTEIREFLTYYANVGNEPVASNAKAALAALVRLEREAAERETALASTKAALRRYERAPWEARVREVEAANESLRTAWRENVEEIRLQYQAVVREVEAERDEASRNADLIRGGYEVTLSDLAASEATVARQAETLRDVRGKVYGRAGRWCNEVVRLIDAVLASPEAAAAEPTEWERPLEVGGILWLAAIDRVPIEERIEWVARMKLRVAEINAHRAALAAAALPAVDAPPEPTT